MDQGLDLGTASAPNLQGLEANCIKIAGHLATIQSYNAPPQRLLWPRFTVLKADPPFPLITWLHFGHMTNGPHLWPLAGSHNHMIKIYDIYFCQKVVSVSKFWQKSTQGKQWVHLTTMMIGLTIATKNVKSGWLCDDPPSNWQSYNHYSIIPAISQGLPISPKSREQVVHLPSHASATYITSLSEVILWQFN